MIDLPRKHWLTKQTSLTELRAECVDLELPRQVSRVVLEIAHALERQMLPGDQLWKYSTPLNQWKAACGHSGLAIVREESVVAYREIAMN
jgi:hypothetical protein